MGSPGTSAKPQITAPATIAGLLWAKSCPATSAPRSFSEFERVTRMPVATEMSSAGICAHRPSPTLSKENRLAASAKGSPCWSTPMMMPPIRLIITISTPATASPFTNFEAPSIAP